MKNNITLRDGTRWHSFFVSGILCVLFVVANGCTTGSLDYESSPEDLCFQGDFVSHYLSPHLTHNQGLVTFIVSKDATDHDPWVSLYFNGRVAEPGRAQGTMSLVFPDESTQDFAYFNIRFEYPERECNDRGALMFDDRHYEYRGGEHSLRYGLIRQPE
jgi:hypothetical protein